MGSIIEHDNWKILSLFVAPVIAVPVDVGYRESMCQFEKKKRGRRRRKKKDEEEEEDEVGRRIGQNYELLLTTDILRKRNTERERERERERESDKERERERERERESNHAAYIIIWIL